MIQRDRPRLGRLVAAALALGVPALALALGCRAQSAGDADASVRAEPVATARAASAPVAVASPADAARLASDVAWLADDAREGRRAGTAGADAAATWIAARFAALGLAPAGDDGFFQGFEVPLDARDGGGSRIAVGDVELRGAESVTPLFCSSGGTVEGPLAFGGYGIELGGEPRSWSSYGGVDVKGAVVLIARGEPRLASEAGLQTADPHADPHGAGDTALVTRSAGWGSSGSLFTKVMTARRLGASAVIVAQHPDDEEPPLAFDAGSSAEASIPAFMVSAAAAERILPGYARLVRAIDAEAGALEAESPSARVEADVLRARGATRNVLARLPGGDGPTVLVGAHYDHLGRGGTGSLAPDALGEIHNGADDNASGTAVVLELARLLSGAPKPPRGDVVFALWSGEELGLLGSEHWAKHATLPLDDVALNVNLDMVGRANAGVLQVLGAGTSPVFAGWMEDAGAAAGLELRVSLSGQGLGGSDHQTFLKREIPALHLFSGVHTDYHKPTDDTERFEAEGAARVAALTLDFVDRAQRERALPFAAPPTDATPQRGGGDAGWSVSFGSVPDYAWDGAGLRISGTSAGSPAERAGFLGGDVLTGFGGIEIETIYDFVYALSVHKPGDVVLVRYLREDEPREARVTLTRRGRQ